MQGASLTRRAATRPLSFFALASTAVATPFLCAAVVADDGATTVPDPAVPFAMAVSDKPRSSWFDGLDIGGYLKNETAFRISEPRSITKIRNIVALDGTWDFSSRLRLGFSAWAYHDLAYELFDYRTISARFARDADQPLVFIDNLAEEKDSPVAAVRELYLDMYFDRFDLRVGRQFVIWGVLEGVRITDEINPMDFRELILPDLLDYRIPLWSVKLDWYAEDGSDLQVLWIPDLRFHKPAPPGSEWELLQRITDPDGNEVTSYPGRNFRNSEIGLRYSTRLLETDVSFSWFYTWDDFPVLFRSAAIESAEEPVFFPAYTRINIYGATAVRPLGDGVLKLEAAYVPDKYFGLRNDSDIDGDGFLDSQGVLQRRHIRWGVGYEFQRWGIDFAPAITQWVILGHDERLIQDQLDTSLTLFLRKPIPEQSMVFQLLAIALINMEELYLKPKLILNVTDHFQIAAGLDLFFGEASQFGISGGSSPVTGGNTIEQNAHFFGNFSGNDRIFAEFRYTF
jgi:hypothetical protein